MVESRTIASIAAGSTAAICLGYCVYFDHKRRTDAAFRMKLLRENRRLEKAATQHAEQKQQDRIRELKRKLDVMSNEATPNMSMEESEAYFMEQVSLGETLAAQGSDCYVDAAIHFYRALRVYPAQAELVKIYEKTQPPEVYQYCMVCVAHDLTKKKTPIIEEIDDDAPATKSKPASRTASQTGSERSKASSAGSPSSYDFVEKS